ncbi:hypothetical protein RRG08_032130 [Elysia crispata]|uniref:Uncharacterized protein n=1 Tax=Elysia crispata TaxID=231223 RepID=A0AAE0ZDY9_9GAST|nr:hypothetical protein RRG08_032130 [Elysia crispata]
MGREPASTRQVFPQHGGSTNLSCPTGRRCEPSQTSVGLESSVDLKCNAAAVTQLQLVFSNKCDLNRGHWGKVRSTAGGGRDYVGPPLLFLSFSHFVPPVGLVCLPARRLNTLHSLESLSRSKSSPVEV